MKTAPKNKVTARIFVGCPMSSEMKMYLKKSELWKQASIDQTGLTVVNYQSKEYLGLFLDHSYLSLINEAAWTKTLTNYALLLS